MNDSLMGFSLKWSRRDSNSRPDKETVALSTCLATVRLSGIEKVSSKRYLFRSYFILPLHHNFVRASAA